MNKISKGAKIGLLIELISGVIMAILIITSKPVPTAVAWLFVVGLIITLTSSLMELKK